MIIFLHENLIIMILFLHENLIIMILLFILLIKVKYQSYDVLLFPVMQLPDSNLFCVGQC